MPGDVTRSKDLRGRTDEELEQFIQQKAEELFKLRFQHFTGQLENTTRLKIVRRELARAKTIATQRVEGSAAS